MKFLTGGDHSTDSKNLVWQHEGKSQTQCFYRDRLIQTEDRPMVARGEGWGGWVKRGKGLGTTDRQSQIGHEEVKHRTGGSVNTIAMAVCGAGGGGGRWKYRGAALSRA